MLKDNESSKILFYVKKSKELYDSIIEKEAKNCGITKKEADILLFFYNNKDLDTAIDAVKYRGFSKSYVSKALMLLSKRNFIEVNTDNVDKRYQRIIILDSANDVITRLKKAQNDYFSSIRGGISDKDFKTHIQVVEKMTENVKNMMRG